MGVTKSVKCIQNIFVSDTLYISEIRKYDYVYVKKILIKQYNMSKLYFNEWCFSG